jgi:hypothetical protein
VRRLALTSEGERHDGRYTGFRDRQHRAILHADPAVTGELVNTDLL